MVTGGIVKVRTSCPRHHPYHKKKIKFGKMLGWDTYPYKNSTYIISTLHNAEIVDFIVLKDGTFFLEETLMTGKFKEHVIWG